MTTGDRTDRKSRNNHRITGPGRLPGGRAGTRLDNTENCVRIQVLDNSGIS